MTIPSCLLRIDDGNVAKRPLINGMQSGDDKVDVIVGLRQVEAGADAAQNLTFAKLGPRPFLPRPCLNLTESCRLYKGGY